MKPTNGSEQSNATDKSLPNSRKIYVTGKLHADVKVPFREINLAPTKTMSGEMEVNEPVRVYDTSGPWGDPSVTLDPVKGLPPLRRDWILARGDVEEIEGRAVTPIDDGYLSDKHAAIAAQRSTSNAQRPTPNGNSNGSNESGESHSNSKLLAPSFSQRRPLRARAGRAVTQLAPVAGSSLQKWNTSRFARIATRRSDL